MFLLLSLPFDAAVLRIVFFLFISIIAGFSLLTAAVRVVESGAGRRDGWDHRRSEDGCRGGGGIG